MNLDSGGDKGDDTRLRRSRSFTRSDASHLSSLFHRAPALLAMSPEQRPMLYLAPSVSTTKYVFCCAVSSDL